MSQNEVRVRYTRGGREFSRRSFSIEEIHQTPFQSSLPGGFTTGLGGQCEIYVRNDESDNEISVTTRRDSSFESLLRAASEDGEITGKTFTIDCTAEHRGARESSGVRS